MNKLKIKNVAKNVIQYEIEALIKLKKNLNVSLLKVINTILNCKNGKIIISGVGKSGIIARKGL